MFSVYLELNDVIKTYFFMKLFLSYNRHAKITCDNIQNVAEKQKLFFSFEILLYNSNYYTYVSLYFVQYSCQSYFAQDTGPIITNAFYCKYPPTIQAFKSSY